MKTFALHRHRRDNQADFSAGHHAATDPQAGHPSHASRHRGQAAADHLADHGDEEDDAEQKPMSAEGAEIACQSNRYEEQGDQQSVSERGEGSFNVPFELRLRKDITEKIGACDSSYTAEPLRTIA